jgi:hypothetical protein
MGTVPDHEDAWGDERRNDDAFEFAEEINPQRLLDVQLRIATGFYDRPAVLLATAGRILEERDVSLPY